LNKFSREARLADTAALMDVDVVARIAAGEMTAAKRL
jgi:hypothetical protein